MEQVLCYFPSQSDPRLTAIGCALLPLRLRLRTADPEQTGQKVGFLLGRKDFEASEGEAPAVTDPILILDGLSEPRFDAVLRALAKTKASRTVYKAVATATNVDWTLYALWRELQKEREALEQGETPVHQK